MVCLICTCCLPNHGLSIKSRGHINWTWAAMSFRCFQLMAVQIKSFHVILFSSKRVRESMCDVFVCVHVHVVCVCVCLYTYEHVCACVWVCISNNEQVTIQQSVMLKAAVGECSFLFAQESAATKRFLHQWQTKAVIFFLPSPTVSYAILENKGKDPDHLWNSSW